MSDASEPNRILVQRKTIPVRWGDMDALGHVNNTVYFQYLEELRVAWFERLGVAVRLGGSAGPVIVTANARFQRPLHFPADVLGRLYVTAVGRSSVRTWAELSRTDDPDTVCFDCDCTIVMVDYDSNRSVPLTPELREQVTTPLAG